MDVSVSALFSAEVAGSKNPALRAVKLRTGGMEHRPVMPGAVLDALNVKPDGIYIDGTFGRGGHARLILDRLGPEGRLLIIDRDPLAIVAARDEFAHEPRVFIVHERFGELAGVVARQNWLGQVAGILFDLGVSSPQLDDAGRGFSFRGDGPLDMRMNPREGMSAATWLAQAEQEQIAQALWQYGEERYARRIARAIVEARGQAAITRTAELAALIAEAVPTRERHKDPATRTFQALRIVVNNELGELERGLDATLAALAPNGRLVVISFHSLEDRMVKRFMRDHARGLQLPPGIPVTGRGSTGSALRIVAKALKASAQEVADNPRSRSAVLRVAERLAT